MSETKAPLKICFIWYWDRASEIMTNWRDGYRAAIEEVEKKHNVHWFVDQKLPENDGTWDFIWIWGDSNCPAIEATKDFPCRKGLSLTTDPTNFENLKKMDVVFVESDPIYHTVRNQGIRTIKAFGTDTDFFAPGPVDDITFWKDYPNELPEKIKFFYPATFSPWKRQSSLAYLGKELLCVGTIQPDGDQELKECRDNEVNIMAGYFPAEFIRELYKRCEKVLIPAVHGSERTVLECMSMNVPVEVLSPYNSRAKSYITELENSTFASSRDFILANYSHKKFAENLLRGIEQ